MTHPGMSGGPLTIKMQEQRARQAPGVSLNIVRMSPDNSPRMRALRMLMMMDGTILVILGALFILMPRHVEVAFHFDNLPAGVDYLIGLWGCTLATLGLGYGIVAMDPRRHIVWVQIGIVRGLLEVGFGGFCIARGIINSQQGSFGIIVAAFIAIAYLALYPRKERV